MSFKMPKEKELTREVEIPSDLEVEIKNNEITVRKEGKEIRKRFPKATITKEENKIKVKIKPATKREKKQINTIAAHINNIIQGLKEKFVYKLQICAVHFPMNVTIKDEIVVIKNFLGETKERRAKILPNVDVKMDKEFITVESVDKEAAGQTAANIEKTTKIKSKDKRIFQDGIFITEKCGRKI